MNMSPRDIEKLSSIKNEILKLSSKIYDLQIEEDRIWNKYGNKIVIHRHEVD